MRVNFFVLTPPGVIDAVPASYITSFHLQASQQAFTRQLLTRFPNLTVIDVAAVINQFQAIIGQVAGAVQFVFLFTLLAGAIVLYSALLSAFEERRYELAIMRALGAHRHQLRQALLTELAVTGGIAGLIAALAAGALGQVIAWRVFDMSLPVDPWLPAAAALGGAALSMAVGWLAVRRLLNTPPLLSLRASG
jgi:putative ABC transport system permease protein